MAKLLQALLILVLPFLLLHNCSTNRFSQNIKIEGEKNSIGYKVDSIVIAKMNQYNIPGLSIGIVKQGEILYTKGYGVRSIETLEYVTENSVFHTASISKLFTAAAIMHLIEQNTISLDTKLIEVIPDLKYTDNRIKEVTIKNLLNHTSGLPDINNYHWGKNNTTKDALKNYVLSKKLSLDFAPSSEFQYSNLTYDILGLVIENVSGIPFEDFLQKELLIKSGMSNSDFRYFKIQDDLKTSPHSKQRLGDKIYKRKVYPYTREHAPSSTLNASAKDISQWMIYFLEDLALSESISKYSEMIVPSFDAYPYIGLGFQLNKIGEDKTIGHYGGDKGFRSYLLMVPEKEIGVVLLGNCDYEEDFRDEVVYGVLGKMERLIR